MLTKDQILASKDLKIDTVEVPEWGGDVGIRVMSGSERFAWNDQAFKEGKVDMETYQVALLTKCLCDDKGERLFTDSEMKALAGKNMNALKRVFDACEKLNKLTADDVDDLVKN